MSFAKGTVVPVDRSQAELSRVLKQHGASGFGTMREGDRAQVLFRLQDRNVRLSVDIPPIVKPKWGPITDSMMRKHAAEERRRWRVLLLLVKAKLEVIADKSSTVEREFMPDVMLPNGVTVSEIVAPEIRRIYDGGQMSSSLLLGPASK